MNRYEVKMVCRDYAEPVRDDMDVTFQISAKSLAAAEYRVYKLMSYMLHGIIEEKNLNPAIEDDGYGELYSICQIGVDRTCLE